MIRILVTLCSLSTGQCHEVQVTNSDMADLTMTACMVGMPAIAEWAKSFPQYRVSGWRCQVGTPIAKEHA